MQSIWCKDKQKAYREISFEQEAYDHEYDFNYLKIRKFWGFLKYWKNADAS